MTTTEATWVLLRGLTREARHWGDFPDQLAERLKQPVLTQDLPGNGAFNHLPSPTSVRGMTEFVRTQLQAKGHPPPYRLLAMSLGGMVATDWAQNWPQDVVQLVLINTSMRPHSRLAERLRPANWPQLALLAARWHDTDYAESVVHSLTCNRQDNRATDLADWGKIRKAAPVLDANARRQLWAAARFTCAPQRPDCSVLLLSSASDHLVHPHCTARLATAWQAPHAQHRWAGHDLPHDDAPWVLEQLVKATR
jgi:pimeloyl-ACP methyl ester carboxylesterase